MPLEPQGQRLLAAMTAAAAPPPPPPPPLGRLPLLLQRGDAAQLKLPAFEAHRPLLCLANAVIPTNISRGSKEKVSFHRAEAQKIGARAQKSIGKRDTKAAKQT